MKVFFKKIIKWLMAKYSTAVISKKQKRNLFLRENKVSDFQRWRNNRELYEDWNERTAILGDYIKPNASIIEFGAGKMFLKKYLSNYKKYIPSDIVNRYEETIICDLNTKINFDLSEFDTAVFSGVLEYVYNVDDVFQQLGGSINQVVLSYSCSDVVKLSRDKNGWLSDCTKLELEKIFEKNNYEINNYKEWRKQSIYNLIKK